MHLLSAKLVWIVGIEGLCLSRLYIDKLPFDPLFFGAAGVLHLAYKVTFTNKD